MILMTFEIEHVAPRKLTTVMVAAPPACTPDYAVKVAMMMLRSRAFSRIKLIVMNQVHGWLGTDALKEAGVIELTVEDIKAFNEASGVTT